MNEESIAEEAQRRLEERRKELHGQPKAVGAVKVGDVSLPHGLDALGKLAAGMTEDLRTADLAEYKQRAADDRQRKGEGLLTEAITPERQRNVEDLDRSGEWGKCLKKLEQKLGTGFMVALAGGRGNGKTQIAVELIRFLAFGDPPKRSRFCTATEFFMEIKAGYRDGGKSEADVIREFSRPRLLVIDEVSKRRDSEWENLLLHELLNRRYNAMTDTLLISNQDAKQLEESLGAALVSRMRETGGVIEAVWPSFRK